MAETLTIQITAKDGATQVFKAVASSAQQVGKAVEDAGRKGDAGFDKVEKGAKDAEKAVDRVGDSAKRASVSFSDFSVAITAIGAGLIKAGDAALDQQQTIIGLEAAYGDAADEMLRFADEMSNATIFNDDDILRGERYFATLRNNYDLTIQEVQQLMQVTADLASAYGTTFEDASSRITAAIRGEGEAAEFLGLTMNQQAIDRDNLTLTMSNQEAAQFRLNALYEQTGVYAGTSAALLESEVGTRAKLTNALQDNAQALASFTGPLITQLAGLGLASTGLLSMAGAFKNLVPAVRNSQRAMTALSLAFNPLTLTMSAVATGAYIIWDAYQEGERVTNTLADAIERLDAVQEDLVLSGDAARAFDIQAMEDYVGAVLEAAEARKRMFFDGDQATRRSMADELGMTDGEALRYFREELSLSAEDAERLTGQMDRLSIAMADTRVDSDALGGAVEQLWMRFMTDTTYTLPQFIADLEAIDVTAYRAAAALDKLGASARSFVVAAAEIPLTLMEINREASSGALDIFNAGLTEMLGNFGNAGEAAQGLIEGVSSRAREELEELIQLNADFVAGFLSLSGDGDFLSQWNMTGLASEASELAEAITDIGAAMENTQRVIIGNTDAIGNQMQGLEDWALELINVRGTWGEIDALLNEGRISLDKYNEAQVAQEQISASNATVQRDLLAIQAAQAPILAENAEAYAAYIEQLRQLNDGIDDTADGAQRQLAALGMMDDAMLGQVQQFADMTSMMGNLGPEGAASMQMLIDSIVATDPVLTAMLDQMGLIEQQANGTYTLNLDAAGAISDMERLTASIDALNVTLGGTPPTYEVDVQADVAGADAEVRNWAETGYTGGYFNVPVKIDFSAASDAGSAVLGAAQSALADIQNHIEISVTTTADTSEADTAIATMQAYDGTTVATPVVMVAGDSSDAAGTISAMGGYDGVTIATAIVAVDGDSSGAAGVIQAMGGYDGLVLATAYVDIVTRRSTVEENSRHGGVPGFAMGGIPVELAEAGPEMLHFANGGTAIAPTRGIYDVPPMTYVQPHNAVGPMGGTVFNITVNGSDAHMIKQVFANEIVPNLERTLREERRGQVSA